MRIRGNSDGYLMLLTGDETRAWAHKPGALWPSSQLAGRSLMVEVDRNGLCGLTVDDKDPGDQPANEISACVEDHLPARFRHLWPTWRK